MRVGVIADTHIADQRRSIPAVVLEAFTGTDCILHAGDLVCSEVLETLTTIAPVHAVFGNMDPPNVRQRLQASLVVEVGGLRLGLTHGHLGRVALTTPQRALERFSRVPGLSAVVFGHSHDPYNQRHGGILLFNPGSPTERRRQPRPSYGLLEIRDTSIQGTIVYLDTLH